MAPAQRPSYWRALATRERVGWIAYDWANSAFVLCVITVIGSAYFVGLFESAAEHAGGLRLGPTAALRVGGVALTAEAAWSLVVGLSAAIVAFSSPFLGAIADAGGLKKRFLQAYCLLGVLCTLALWFPLPWWAVGLLVLASNVGFEGGNVYYNGFLPDIAGWGDQDAVSSAGYAFGYIGGSFVLVASLVLFTDVVLESPLASIRTAFPLVALWWGGFALLTFSWLKERPGRPGHPAGLAPRFRGALRELHTTLANLSRTPQAVLFLGAFLLYNDGIATLISNVTPYALQNIYLDAAHTQKIGPAQLIPAILLVQVLGFPSSLFCGWLATEFGEKRTLYFTLAVFIGVVGYGRFVSLVSELYAMAALIGLVLGGSQAISRSLFASFVPAGRNAEFFAFFALSSKFSAMIGPLVYGGLLLLTGDTRQAILSLVVFFLAGGGLLSFVDVARGRADARRHS
jgi:UMF1 family MFS transporter